jgi:hypothetical protein
MERRSLLAAFVGGIFTLFSGCTGTNEPESSSGNGDVGTSPTAKLTLNAVTDVEIARQATYRIDLPHRSTQRDVAIATIIDGPEIVTATNPPVPENRPIVYDGAVFELSYEKTSMAAASEFRLTLSSVESSTEANRTVEFRELPAVDRTKLQEYGWEDGGPFESAGVPIVYTDKEIADSALVPDPEYDVIEWETGYRARITVERSGDTERNVYKYTARKVHESAQEFGGNIRKQHRIVLDGLPSDQRTIVSQAIEDNHGYEVTTDELPEAFSQLVERFAPSKKIPRTYGETPTESSVSGSYVVRYEGDVYWAELVL